MATTKPKHQCATCGKFREYYHLCQVTEDVDDIFLDYQECIFCFKLKHLEEMQFRYWRDPLDKSWTSYGTSFKARLSLR